MKKKFLYIIAGLSVVLFGCESPDDIAPETTSKVISSVSATFVEGDYSYDKNPNSIFTYLITNENESDFKIEIPWFYPEETNNQPDITKMQVRAKLANNCYISPELGVLDLSQVNTFTLTDYNGGKRQITITGEVYKLRGCTVDELTVTDNLTGEIISGIIDEARNQISIISTDALTDVNITYELYPHATATITGGSFNNVDLSTSPQMTVTAHNGVDTKTYTIVKDIPNKVTKGIREGSAKLLFAKQLNADLGITTANVTGGIAATKDYVVINTRNEASVYIHAKTGAKIGAVNLGAITGNLTNFYNTADSKGNILINNLSPGGGTFKIYKLTSVTGTPQLFIDWTGSGATAIGRKVSVQGNIDGNAIITAPIHDASVTKFARWTVVGGVLTSHTPDIVTVSGWSRTSPDNIDVVYTSDTNVNADYFLIGYSNNRLTRIDGTTNTVKAQLDVLDTNYITNAVDFTMFNNNEYVAYGQFNSFTWGQADQAWVINAESGFSGNPGASGTTGNCSGAIWGAPKGTYGPNAIGGVQNGNGSGDVALRVSDDGYYMYMYFMITNGYVVGVQFDCIDM
ncbi:DUF5018 domain-containing protein [Dysgonomonas sp. 25]|uniref:DUF5018 domain-containing protein n=1 Tax=Dysgonomonas sp. 25 TaxID=2302933 RepID=UPI0013D67FAC|nr:DUF5018 domain-containing protein [Dysgonomonas sp. 25]NDV69699.1 DUF5018 domain-containing protein [Dysgonomonas sp. 25]